MGWKNDIKESFTRLASERLSKKFSAVSDDHLGTSSSRNVDDGSEMTGQVGLQHIGGLLLSADKGCPRGVML